jgi:phosphoribosylanthranilate isomerase
MNRTRVKICGITRPEDALAAADAGADAIGLVFWPGSKRIVPSDTAAVIASMLPPSVAVVGVFVDPSVEDVLRAADHVGITVVQICGTRNDQDWATLPRAIRIIRAVTISPNWSMPVGIGLNQVADYLADNGSAEAPGGTGVAYDWRLATRLKSYGRLWLAGGLNPQKVGEAIAAVRPHAVDVSSGVETAPGVKSPELIRAFIESVHLADHALSKGDNIGC